MRFSELFAETTSRSEVVVTFLALLELIRMKHLRVLQPEPFSEIEISLAPPRIEAPHDVNASSPSRRAEDSVALPSATDAPTNATEAQQQSVASAPTTTEEEKPL
jgi:hypothetical protein